MVKDLEKDIVIERFIIVLRGQRVMLGNDIARLYGVTTRRLNEQVRRNPERFPEDFMFQLTKQEKQDVVANCDHLENLKYSQSLPYAFTEHGVVMLANVLNSQTAIKASIQVARAFVRLRYVMASQKELARKIDALESKYDARFKAIFDAIRQLMTPPPAGRKQVGFHWEKEKPTRGKPRKERGAGKKADKKDAIAVGKN